MKEKTFKKKRKRLIFRAVLLVVMAGLVVFAIFSSRNDDKQVIAKGEKAPNFQLEKFGSDGETLALEDLKGKGVMINFWATYCPPCKEEMPYFEQVYSKYKDKGVEFVTVNLDSTDLVVQKFINKYQLSFPVLRDKSGEVMDLYNVDNLPATLFVNKDGEIVDKVIGELTLDKLEGYLKEITPED
ncbi:thiol-disulfide oxidoreductase ResA [Halobacillus salinarum]|uniref:Thiol-disulfide oxidoreductase ResA n=1 Tax=Halobacillus salinarum TaxID=2932257 RepID=A0ABY4EFA8_9BACI|nr:thiol-disulfide oxidoreductase ResA [Halobacillus salinarum]UOQ42665.1 thiol-disulfide oxidoreductase ResA [Halobacillus salinarum]